MIGRDNFTGERPALIAEDVERLLRAMDARPPRRGGAPRGTAGIAEAFGVHPRTLYRYWPGRVEWVEVAGWRMPFLVRPGYRPVLLDARSGARPSLAEKMR